MSSSQLESLCISYNTAYRHSHSFPTRRSSDLVTSASAATLSLAYNGKLRDRVGQGNTALGADGAMDGTLTATLSRSEEQTSELQSQANIVCRPLLEKRTNRYRVLGVAPSEVGD